VCLWVIEPERQHWLVVAAGEGSMTGQALAFCFAPEWPLSRDRTVLISRRLVSSPDGQSRAPCLKYRLVNSCRTYPAREWVLHRQTAHRPSVVVPRV
jgi:hypothetical protein